MTVSKAQQRAVSKYMKENYDELKIRVPKGDKGKIKAYAESRGESVNGFITKVVAAAINGVPLEIEWLQSETITKAEKAAKAAGETVAQFLDRAVALQAERDEKARESIGAKP